MVREEYAPSYEFLWRLLLDCNVCYYMTWIVIAVTCLFFLGEAALLCDMANEISPFLGNSMYASITLLRW